MPLHRIVCFTIIAVLLSGCLVNGIYFSKDLILVPGIEGTWESASDQYAEEPDNWKIQPAPGGGYLIRRNYQAGPEFFHYDLT